MSHEVVLERVYTIPFYPKLNTTPRTKRAPRAMRLVREFITRHMKSDDILIDMAVNEYIWAKGIQKPPRKITVRVEKHDDDVVLVYLVGKEEESVFVPEKGKVKAEVTESDIESEDEFEEESED